MTRKKILPNKKGQFTIIAAVLVAIILIAAVMTTYSAIQYNELQNDPQTQSTIDEVNLALKRVLGFTVGYYGSVLQVTGNTSYAKTLAYNYMRSGLENTADLKADLGASFNATTLDLSTSWFTNTSYSKGNIAVQYDLADLGIYGLTYNTSSRLDVHILSSPNLYQACVKVLKDGDEPLINLGKNSFKFYEYAYSNSTWVYVYSDAPPTSFTNGTYLIDIPSGVDPTAYIISVEDTRGIMVVASSFSKYTSTLTWNATSVETGFDYVDNNSSNVDGIVNVGGGSNFTTQQAIDSIYDSLAEVLIGTFDSYYYPSVAILGSTTTSSGNINNLQSSDNTYLQLTSYASAFSGTATAGYTTAGSSSRNIDDRIQGSTVTFSEGGQMESITAYIRSTATAYVKAAIYSISGSTYTLLGSTEEKTITSSSSASWVTFSFSTKPLVITGKSYLLVLWGSSSGSIYLYRDSASNQGYYNSRTYGSWPSSPSFNNDNYRYSIYCTYSKASQYTASVEFTGSSDTYTLQQIAWLIESSVSTGTASYTLQLYNFASSLYPTSGDGYMTASLTTSDQLKTQTITANPSNFRNSTGYWKMMLTALNTTAGQFDLKLDLAQFTTNVNTYSINLEEQWVSVNATNPRQDLCIKTGSFTTTEGLLVDVWHNGAWVNLMTLSASSWNNVSLAAYIDSSTLTIRFRDANSGTDPTPSSWNIDAIFLKNQPNISFIIGLQESTFTVEILQNGTMIWLGEKIQSSTNGMPIPPIAVKAIHVNMTINGVNQEVPFQVEDWGAEYSIPLGLSNNATVFSNRQMIVILLNGNVSEFTIWWDGSDQANQTSKAYSNIYFSDTPGTSLSNGKVTLTIGSGFTITSTVSGVSSTATFMRINGEASVYGASPSYVIYNGVVRDILQQEAEYSGGAANAPNLYANIVLTLPANVTYYTYKLSIMFINSTQARTLTDLCPISITTSLSSVQAQTENGTLAIDFPIVENGTGTFYNYTTGSWTAHHWSQLITSSGSGIGLMFTDTDNKLLYSFSSLAGNTGALDVDQSTKTIELLPVTSAGSASFQTPLDITWTGAVVAFSSSTTPIYNSLTSSGLWILVEFPPTLTQTAQN